MNGGRSFFPGGRPARSDREKKQEAQRAKAEQRRRDQALRKGEGAEVLNAPPPMPPINGRQGGSLLYGDDARRPPKRPAAD